MKGRIPCTETKVSVHGTPFLTPQVTCYEKADKAMKYLAEEEVERTGYVSMKRVKFAGELLFTCIYSTRRKRLLGSRGAGMYEKIMDNNSRLSGPGVQALVKRAKIVIVPASMGPDNARHILVHVDATGYEWVKVMPGRIEPIFSLYPEFTCWDPVKMREYSFRIDRGQGDNKCDAYIHGWRQWREIPGHGPWFTSSWLNLNTDTPIHSVNGLGVHYLYDSLGNQLWSGIL